jgi:purine-binding chemotaxis protein CheW
MSSDSTRPNNATADPAVDLDSGDDELPPQWLVVRSGMGRYGIPIEQVTEVVRPDGLLAVPGTPPIQAGIVNVRGAIVTVLDLQALLTGERAVTPGSIVLIEHGARPVGLTVDAVHDVRVTGDEASAGHVELLDAAQLVAGHLHSAEERER